MLTPTCPPSGLASELTLDQKEELSEDLLGAFGEVREKMASVQHGIDMLDRELGWLLYGHASCRFTRA